MTNNSPRPSREWLQKRVAKLHAELADAKVHRELLLGCGEHVVEFHLPHGELSSGATKPLMDLARACEFVRSEVDRG